jgi:hypothetical protein
MIAIGSPPRYLFGALLLCACAPQTWAQIPPAASTTTQRAADEVAVTQLERRWVAALAPGGDRSALDDILADDYVDIDWRGRVRHKADLIHATGSPGNTTQQVSALDVRVWGDSAVATGVNTVHSTAKGWTAEVAFTDVFVRVDGHWRAVSSQETPRRSPLPSTRS